MTNTKTRNIGLDLLKVLAMFFVVLLHMCGYAYESQLSNYETVTFDVAYHIIEAIAYPAIHLFVMCGTTFLIKRDSVNKKQVADIYVNTLLVCIIGLIVSLIIGIPITMSGILQSIFPITFRAYWFVSDYIVLILISPLLNKIINHIREKDLLAYTVLILLITGGFSFFLTKFGWSQDYSNIGLFICLYFVVASLNSGRLLNKTKIGIWLWGSGIALVLISWIGMRFILENSDREMFFYAYNSPFVILEAVGAYIFFYNIRMNNRYVSKAISFLSRGSLIVYLIHMHPIIKQNYVSMGTLAALENTSNMEFFILVLSIGGGIVLIGAIINILLNRIEVPISRVIVRKWNEVSSNF